MPSRHDVVDHGAVDVGEAVVAAGVAVRQLLMVEAEEVEDGGVEVVDVDGFFDGFEAELVGGAVDVAPLDEFGFQAAEDKVHVHDLHATILHLLGFNHETFTYRYAGRDFRLTDVHGKVAQELIA